MRSVPLRYRGHFYGRGWRGIIVAAGWPPKQPKRTKNPTTAAQNTGFARMVRASSQQPWHAITSAKLIAGQSGYTWRDVIFRAMVGRLFQLASDNLQAMLDALDEISKVPGSMLFRNTTTWMAIIPEFQNEVLQTGVTGIPAFQQLFAYLSPSEGTMVVYHDGEWQLVANGEAGDVLTWDDPSNLPAWQPAMAGQLYAISCFVPGVLAGSQTLLMHKFAEAVTTPADFGAFEGLSSTAGSSAGATASAVIDIAKADAASPASFTTVGSITFAPGDLFGTFATVSGAEISWQQDDVLRAQGPVVPDATLSDFTATFVGHKT
jgi:hypothetical protein